MSPLKHIGGQLIQSGETSKKKWLMDIRQAKWEVCYEQKEQHCKYLDIKDEAFKALKVDQFD